MTGDTSAPLPLTAIIRALRIGAIPKTKVESRTGRPAGGVPAPFVIATEWERWEDATDDYDR